MASARPPRRDAATIDARLYGPTDVRHRVATELPRLALTDPFDPAELSNHDGGAQDSHPAWVAELSEVCWVGNSFDRGPRYH